MASRRQIDRQSHVPPASPSVRQYATAYRRRDRDQAFFAEAPKKDHRPLPTHVLRTHHTQLGLGLDLDQLRQASFFTATGKIRRLL